MDKDPSAVIDSILRGTVVDDIVQDGISAAHPFGALVAAPLLDAAGVLHVDPVLRVMPDDPALGEFRAEFAGMLGLIEERPDENDGERAAFEGTVRVIGAERLTERTDAGPADRVDARAFLTARVMDIFLGDWDRHRGQWRWATYDQDDDDERSWLPVPTDRDQAFSKFDGMVPRTMSLYMPQFVRFEADYPNVERLHWNGRALDRQFLAGLERPVWDSIGASVQANLTDDVIEEAVGRLPSEIFAINGPELIGALKARRDNLTIPVESLYELIAKVVDLHATDVSELVVVDRTDPDFVTVSLADSESADAPYLQRRFSEEETDEIRIYVKGGDDQVSVVGDGGGGITVRVMGGPGDDTFQVNDSRDDVRLYDWQGNNTVSGSDAPRLDAKEFDQWVWSEEDRDQPRDWGSGIQPIFWTSFSTDLGVFLGGGVHLERYGFRKAPFSSGIDFKGGFSTTRGTGRAEIDGRLNRANSPVFTAFQLRYSALDVLHFFGFGNDTPSADNESFFKVDQRATSLAASIGVGWDSGLELTTGLVASHSNSADNANRFFGTLPPGGISSPRDTLYGAIDFWQAGATASLVYDPPVDPDESANRFRLEIRGATFPAIFDVTTPFTKVGAGISKTARMRGLLYGLAMVAVAGCASSFNSLQRADPAGTPAPLAIEQRLILIGDAGTLESAGVLQVMADSIRNLADITTVVFLGDNVYPAGVPSDTASYRGAAEEVLRQQVVAGTTEGATAIFVAGNHDWKHALPGIIAQAQLVSQFGGPQARFLPQPPGCPGPESVALGERVLLVTLDTEWMLMEDKPAGPCANRTNQEVLQDLEVMLASRGSRDVVIAAHHPLRTKGVHGGKCGVLCLRQIWKSIVGDEQALRHARNREMRNGIADAIRSARPVVYAAGHDHSMQVFEGAEGSEVAFFLVSGRGAADTHDLVGHDESTLYAADMPGFMILDFLSQDRVLLRVIETETGDVYVRALR